MSMKYLILLAVGCLLAFEGAAQPSKKELLVKNAWKIQSDEMSGLGVHTSLHKDTELQFSLEGTWKSSQPIREASSGMWRLENNDRTLVLTIDQEETRYSILQLTEKELHLRLKKNATTTTLKWVSK
jgi:hypothetical protein